MAKGVSGALTRLAKVTVMTPVRGGTAVNRPSPRQKAANAEDDEAFYLPEDADDYSDRRYVKRRTEVVPERSVPVAAVLEPVAVAPAPAAVPPAPEVVSPAAVSAVAAPFGVAAAAGAGAGAAPAPSSYAAAASYGGRGGVRAESFEDMDEYEDVVDDGIPVGRGGGRIAERIRRLRTSLAARSGRVLEAEPAVPERARADARSRLRYLDEDGCEADMDRGIRSSLRPKQVARVRRRLGMTQAEFARCYGIATEDVIRWEAGAKPTRAERVLLTLIMHDPEEMARLVDEALALS